VGGLHDPLSLILPILLEEIIEVTGKDHIHLVTVALNAGTVWRHMFRRRCHLTKSALVHLERKIKAIMRGSGQGTEGNLMITLSIRIILVAIAKPEITALVDTRSNDIAH